MLPVKKVVLYKHGVGYFERQGEVEGNASIGLHFKSDEMNDVLKSLTVLDLTGGLISSISYESTKPVHKQLEDISIRIPDGDALTGLLSQVKGARAKIKVGSEELTGTVTGIQKISKIIDRNTVQTYLLSILIDGKTLVSIDIMEIKSITFLDDNLKTDLNHLLEILISSKKKDAKKLTIFTHGEGKRQLLAGYVIETPVWKASYRVLLDDESEKPTIQGWALVDNTRDEDWEDVRLTLVAGLPVSFVHDLYSPRYKKRPVVEIQEEEAYAPPILEEGMGEPEMEMAMADEMMFAKAAPPKRMAATLAAPAPSVGGSYGAMRGGGAAMLKKKRARKSSMPVQTRTVEVGDLFQYEIANPVTVKRNQSALVPTLQSEFKGKRVAIYNQDIREKNPMSALLIKNTTGLTLEGGPMTVMENENYVGESMMDTLKPEEERIIPFSVELGCVITMEKSQERMNYHRMRIQGGFMYLDYYQIEESSYLVKNKTDKELDMYLEHRFIHGWELYDTPIKYEKTENFYRFNFKAPAKKTHRFTVKEKHQEYESYGIRYIDTDNVAYWSRNGFFDSKIKAKLEEVMKASGKISSMENKIEKAEESIEEIHNDQKRLRENLKALGTSVDENKLRERYVAELNEGEDELKALRNSLKEMKKSLTAMEDELDEMIEGIEINREL